MDKFSSTLNYIAAGILTIIVLGSLWITFKRVMSHEDPIKTININYSFKNDSINKENSNQIMKVDSVLSDLKNFSVELNKSQEKFIEIKNEKVYDKIYAAIITAVIAIAGFFGFKNVNEIKDRSIKDAKDQAESVAKSQFQHIFTRDYEKQVEERITSILVDKLIKPDIERLESRILQLESNQPSDTNDSSQTTNGNPSDENNNDNPTNPFENL